MKYKSILAKLTFTIFACASVPGIANAEYDKLLEKMPATIDCTRADFPQSVEDALAARKIQFKPEYKKELMDVLSGFSVLDHAWPEGAQGADMETAATLYHHNTMVAAEMLFIDRKLNATRIGADYGKLIAGIYEPYFDPYSRQEQDGAEEYDPEGFELSQDLIELRRRLISIKDRLPFFMERPVRWYFQGRIYADPIAVEVASGMICRSQSLSGKVDQINREAEKID